MASDSVRNAVLTPYVQTLIEFKARQLCRKPGFKPSEADDLKQEMIVTLLARAHLYDARRGSVNTFADRVVNSAFATMLRHRHRLKRAPEFRAISLEHTHLPVEGGVKRLRDLLTSEDWRRRTGAAPEDPAQRERAQMIADVEHSLPPHLQDLCRRLKTGTENSVARDLGISRRQVRNGITQLLKEFERAGLGT